ncbi:MAG: alternative ribosome rescue aminoacyl-tRNA hydrolase ArfB [Psychroflexus halocasei]
MLKFDKNLLEREIDFQTSLSGGPGGQHVNKTETKVTLKWNFESSEVLSEVQKNRIRQYLERFIVQDDYLQMSSAETRSQHKNKKLVFELLMSHLEKAFQPKKKRKKTKPSKMQKLKRLQSKKKQSEKKSLRKKPDY